MPGTDDKIYGPNKIDEVIIAGKNMKRKRYLDLPGELYYHNIPLFREAMKYMRQIGDKKAEQQLFLKRMRYGSNESAKGIFMLIGGTVGTVFTVGVVAPAVASSPMALSVAAKIGRFAKPTWKFYKATTYWRMGINAGVQTMIERDVKRINLVSIAAEALPLAVLSPMAEYRPFDDRSNMRFRTVFNQNRSSLHYKSISETMFDLAAQSITEGISQGVSTAIRNTAGKELQDQLVRRLFNNVMFPIYHFGYQTGSQGLFEQIKKDALSVNTNGK